MVQKLMNHQSGIMLMHTPLEISRFSYVVFQTILW